MNKKIIYIFGAIIIICLIVLIVIFAYKQITVKVVEKENFYKVDISINSGVSEPSPYAFDNDYGSSELGNYLIDVLGIAKPVARGDFYKYISLIVNETQAPDNNTFGRFNATYFVFSKLTIDTQKIYKNGEFTAKVSGADPKLLPFVLDSSYCEVATDCSLGRNFCDDGSWNKFRKYIDVWGCEGPTGATKDEWEMCGAGKYPVVKYSGESSCVNNKCVAQNRKVTCLEGELP